MGTNPVAPGVEVAGSTCVKFGAVGVAAAVGGEVLGEDKESIADMVVAAGVAAARKVLDLRSVALRAAAAVAAVDGRGSRTMLGRLEVVTLSLGWSFEKCAMARSDARIGGAAGAFESHAGAVVLRAAVAADIAVVEVEVDIAEWGFAHKRRPVLAGCTETFCSYLGMAQGMVLVRVVLVGIRGSHLETEEVVHSCQTVVRCQSSSFPYHPGDSSEQH